MNKTSYEDFYRSAEYMSVEDYEKEFGVDRNHDKVTGVFCYLGCGLHIDCMENGYGLILDRTYFESKQLHELEEKLYEFCDEEGYLDEGYLDEVDFEIDKYVDWSAIAKDFDLKSGDITPEQLGALEGTFEQYIKQNK